MSDIAPEDRDPTGEIDVPIMGWSGVMVVLNRWAGNLDRRIIRTANWLSLPRTFGRNHDSDEAIGSIDHMEIREEDGVQFVWGRGRFSNTADGIKAARQLQEQVLRTVSVELRDGEVVTAPVLGEEGEEIGTAADWQWATVGSLAFERQSAHGGAAIMSDPEAAAYVPPAPVSRPGEGTLDADDVILGEAAVLSAAVGVLRAEEDRFRQAGAGPHQFPAAHFTRYDVGGPTRWNVTADGEVTGTPIIWGKTHRANSQWTAAMNPRDDLSEWLVGATHLDDGQVIRTGVIVSDGLHAPAHQRGASGDSIRHLIESTATQLAVVNAWQDQHGIHVHGSTLPGVTPEQVTRALAGCLSVDQRDLGDGRGFVTMGVLAVNTCGFSPDTAIVTMEDGEPVRRLVASAAPSEDCGCGGTCGGCGHGVTAELTIDMSAAMEAVDQLEDAVNAAVSGASVRAASAEENPKPPPVVDLAALREQDARWERERLAAAVSPKPKG